MENKTKQDGRANNGGYRPGSGRPAGRKNKKVWLSLPEELADRISALEKKNQVAEQLWAAYFKGQ